MTTCQWYDFYECLDLTRCEKQADGQCGWTQNKKYSDCMEKYLGAKYNSE